MSACPGEGILFFRLALATTSVATDSFLSRFKMFYLFLNVFIIKIISIPQSSIFMIGLYLASFAL